MFVIVRVVDIRITNDDANPRHFRMNLAETRQDLFAILSFCLLLACRVYEPC